MRRNKVISLLLIIAIGFLLVSCGQTSEPEKTEPEPTEAGSEQTSSTTTTTTTTTTKTTTKRTTTTTTKKPDFASRKNPARMGDGVIITGSNFYGEYEYVVTLNNLIRGEEALTLAKKWNRYNAPGDGEEFIIVDIEFELMKWNSARDEKFFMSEYSFEYYTGNYERYRPKEYIYVEDDFLVETYDKTKVEAKLGFTVPIDDKGYIVLDDFAWWKIG